MKVSLYAGILGILISPSLAGCQQEAPRFERRWVWVMCNLQVAKEADRVVSLIERASKSGYTGVVISDYKLNFLNRVPDFYFKNVERVKDAAKASKIELIPAVFPIGYANGLLSNDVNLAEGMPVIDAEFTVKGDTAQLVPSPLTQFRNGGLEQTLGDRILEFSHQDEPSKCTVVDRDEHHGGVASCRMQRLSETPNCRLIQSVKTQCHGAYRFSAWVKTKDLSPTGAFRLLAIGKDGRILTFHEGGIDASADWKQVEVVFNSLGNTEVSLYVGIWGGRSGSLWVDDVQLEEMGLTNVLRRPGCPLVIKSADGKTVYTEGVDFDPVADPLLGRVPYEGEYAFNHPSPPIRVTKTSRIKDGDRLLVSWYHPVLVHGNVVMCCLSEPKVYALLEDQARRVNELYRPSAFFMQHDEMRVANWCQACLTRKLTPGGLLADNARLCTQILKRVAPEARVVVWSDMFDPNHNAVNNYYLVNGTLEKSWEGLDSSVIIANWNGGKPRESLEFFAGRGHEQVIAGYYDHDDNLSSWLRAASGIPKVDGFMYTTWIQRYIDLEKYGKSLQPTR